MRSNTIYSRLRASTVQEGCALLFSEQSHVTQPALIRIVEELSEVSSEFFNIEIHPTSITVCPKFQAVQTPCVQITRYAAGGRGRMCMEGYTFLESIRDGCNYMRIVISLHVKDNIDEAQRVVSFKTKYLPQ